MTDFELSVEVIQPKDDGETRRLLTLLEKLRKALRLPGSKDDLLSYAWLQQQMEYPRGKYILCHSRADHIAPWFLAENGARVLLVERGEERYLPLIFRSRYAVGGFYQNELESTFATIKHTISQAEGSGLKLISLVENIAWFLGSIFPPIGKGSVLLLRENPTKLEQIPDEAVDQIVVPDTLGKYSLEQLKKVLPEMLRTLKSSNNLLFNVRLTNDKSIFQDENKNWVYPLEKFAEALRIDQAQKKIVSETISKAEKYEMPQGGGSPIVEVGFKLTKLEEDVEDEE